MKMWSLTTKLPAFVCGVLVPVAYAVVALLAPVACAQTAEVDLSSDQVVTIRADLARVNCELMAAEAAKRHADKPVVPYLIQVASDVAETTAMRCGALAWLGKTRDPHGVPVMEEILALTQAKTLDPDEYSLLHGAIYALGYSGNDHALDLLFKMATRAHWEAQGSVPVCPQRKNADTQQESLRRLRVWASGAIAASGTERAIHAFATGEGIDEDRLRHCPFELDIAVYRKCGIERIPDKIEDLDQEAQGAYRRAWEEIEGRYGTREEIAQRLAPTPREPAPEPQN
ncbi:MAG: hypothetical protein JXR94_06705 [Candidatus Hydrogenedentes bacterium]|nr:hypothetical protein [Candidatus Hydrogenedentota bacterium]